MFLHGVFTAKFGIFPMKAKDSLFIAMTRPPMIMGVTFLFMGLNIFTVAFVFVITKNLLHLIFHGTHPFGWIPDMSQRSPTSRRHSQESSKDFWSHKSKILVRQLV